MTFPKNPGLTFSGVVALLAIAIPFATNRSQSSGQSPEAAKQRAITMVYEGFTEPRHDIMVAAAEIGRLESVNVEVGDCVQANQVIGKLEDALQVASVRIAELQAGMVGELEAVKAETKLNETRAAKLRKLAAEAMARPDELRRAEADLQVSLARKLAIEEQLQLRQLELERYQLQLQRREIRSPMAGVISKVFHKPGEYITPGDPAVVRLLVTDTLFAVFNVPVEDVSTLKLGAPVSVYLRSSSANIDSVITSIAPDIDGESGTVQVRVMLDNPAGKLLVGDRCTLRRSQREERPSAALLPPQRGRANRR